MFELLMPDYTEHCANRARLDQFDALNRVELPHPVVVIEIDVPGIVCMRSVIEQLEHVATFSLGKHLPLCQFIVDLRKRAILPHLVPEEMTSDGASVGAKP